MEYFSLFVLPGAAGIAGPPGPPGAPALAENYDVSKMLPFDSKFHY